jgi:hypothetical protein
MINYLSEATLSASLFMLLKASVARVNAIGRIKLLKQEAIWVDAARLALSFSS